MLLTPVQAGHVYSAMVVLNNIGAKISVRTAFDGKRSFVVMEHAEGTVGVSERDGTDRLTGRNERYRSQAAFAKAYSLEA